MNNEELRMNNEEREGGLFRFFVITCRFYFLTITF